MATVTFDTLKFAERLEKAGLTREQAAAIAEAQKDSLAEALDSGLATSADVLRLEKRIESDILRIENRIDTLELRLTIKLGVFIAAAVGILAAVIKAV